MNWQPSVAAFQAPNRAHGLRFTFHDNGFSAEDRFQSPEGAKRWGISIRLLHYGRANSRELRGFRASSTLSTFGSNAEIHDSSLAIEYINDKDGLRQNFTVRERPDGAGPVVLVLGVETSDEIHTIVSANKAEFTFKNDPSHGVTYSDLNVWDANNSRLPAMMVGHPDGLQIVVDDRDAVYPILVDPLCSHWITYGSQASQKYGYAVADAGNMEALDFGGVVVGAPYFDNGQTDEGKVFVYYGDGSSLSTTVDWSAEGNQAYAHFGAAIVTGLIDSGSYADLVVGAPDYDENWGSDCGKVFAWYSDGGGVGLPSASDWTYSGAAASDGFGFSLGLADVYGDGYPDLIVGAPYEGSSDYGAAYLFNSTSSGFPSGWSWTATSSQTDSYFGYSVAGLRNVDGANGEEVAIGAPFYDDGQSDEGAVFVWRSEGSTSGLGNYGTPNNVDHYYQSNQADARFGFSIAGGADFENDSYFDMAVGAPKYDNGSADEGVVFVYKGGSSGLGSSHYRYLESNQAYAQLGFSVSAGRVNDDTNGILDSFGDLLVGTPYWDRITMDGATTSDVGRWDIWYGEQTNGINGNADFGGEADQANMHYGFAIAVVNRVTYAGGNSGFIVSAPDFDDAGGNSNVGFAQVLIYQATCP